MVNLRSLLLRDEELSPSAASGANVTGFGKQAFRLVEDPIRPCNKEVVKLNVFESVHFEAREQDQ